jgi:hypothetical protein
MPPVVAHQEIASRSQVSRAKATRTASPFQQGISKQSEVQRRFDRIVMICPSCARPGGLPVNWRAILTRTLVNLRRPLTDHESIRVIERGGKLSDESKVKLWQPHIAPSLEALQQESKATGRSLGIIEPDAGSLEFFHRAAKADEQEDARGMQASLFEKPLRPLTPPEFVFGYKYTSAGRPHTNTLQDWEVQAAYLAYLKRYGTREEALRMLAEEYGARIPTRHPHFIMGTMKLHPRTFILIGLLRTGVDPGDLARQGSLL